jgi:acetyltransferase-like isoleucine patch superfamily enzyme
MPPPIRRLCFKVIFEEFGAGTFLDYNTYVRYPWKVSIGRAVTINRGCKLLASYHIKDARITISDNVTIGPGVTFLGAGHIADDLSLADTGDSINVGRWVWIGANATIRHGVTIGEGAIVAAGAVVVSDVAAWTVVGGVPSQYIRDRSVGN